MMKKAVVFLFSVLLLAYAVSGEDFSREHSYGEVSTTSPFVMNINDLVFPVTKIEMFVNGSFFNVGVKAENLTEYFKIEDTKYYQFKLSSEVNNKNIEAVMITFRVESDFFKDNKIPLANIYLAKYEDGWERLETNYLEEKANYHYYSAIGDGMFEFAIIAEEDDKILIRTSELPETIIQGRTFVIPVKITNMANVEKDYVISMDNMNKIADWKVGVGQENRAETITIGAEKTKDIPIAIFVKKTSLLGENSFFVVIDNGREIKEFPITADIKGIDEVLGYSVVKVEREFEKIEGDENRIKISITNNGVETTRYLIKTNGIERFGEYYFDESSIVLVDPEETKIIFLNIMPKSGAKGSHEFSVSIESGSDIIEKKQYNIEVISDKMISTNNLELIIMSAILIVVALIFYMYAKRRKK
ncbi:PGF-pre-PGF domain-containing protein [Candidatus Woesearchaeota archaeon]|nr:PGF-pre-PGF domain-containing protein [Candidatus Woesearchaeota archaeon]